LIFDLPFCSDVAYAVPANSTSNRTTLVPFYDDNAKTLYKNFSDSLAQIPCNTTSSAQYSLARDCTDCARDYKTWLCAVTIPRCADFSSPADSYPFLVPRALAQKPLDGSDMNMGNAGANSSDMSRSYAQNSRNSLIDSVINPGPYKEVLPCNQLCYNLVQSCPAALGFACPAQPWLMKWSYGKFNADVLSSNGTWTCNYLGLDFPNAAMPSRHVSFGVLVILALVHFAVNW
jgi:calcium channel MID1